MDSKLIQCANPAQDDARADRFFLFIDRTALSPIIIEETRGLALRPRFRTPIIFRWYRGLAVISSEVPQ